MSQPKLVRRNDISAEAFQTASKNLQQPADQRPAQSQPWELDNRLNLDESQLALAFLLLDNARHQQVFSASPLLSRFRVACSIFCGAGKTAHGANMEYGAGPRRAADVGVHAEEAALAGALGLYGSRTYVEFVAVATDSSQPSTPCGKCRSVIETYSQGDPIIVSVGANFLATMWKLSELMPRDFESINVTELSNDTRALLHSLQSVTHTNHPPKTRSLSEQALGNDYARIIADGVAYSLPRVDSLAFYPTTALRATIAAVLAAKPSRINAVLLSSRSGIPIGEDRQLLFEFANMFGQVQTLPIYLQAEGNTAVQCATPTTLLPYAFGPNDLSLNS
jgi:cytidine deaminase